MPLKSPNLDDRTYEQIVEDAKRLIPGYTKEWTDFNEHDPGITLVQLFAWMTESIIYRLNQVPDKNYIEFLRLVGIELAAAKPAKAHLTFTLSKVLSDPGKKSVDIPAGTQVEAVGSSDGEPVIFETDSLLKAVSAILEEVCVYDGYDFLQRSKENNEINNFYCPFGARTTESSALYLGLSDILPDENLNMRVEVRTFESSSGSFKCNSADDSCGGGESVDLNWEYWSVSGWKKFVILKDETGGFLKSGYIFFKGPQGMSLSNQANINDRKLYWLKCCPVKKAEGYQPQLDIISFNTVQATAAVTVHDEVLGGSSGEANQEFMLRRTPVLEDSLLLEVNEQDDDDTWTEWKQISYGGIRSAKRGEKVYELNVLTGELKFGDGLHGKIPFAGSRNVIARSYRYGGGSVGNVRAGAIITLLSALRDVEGVENKRCAEGGSDEEKIEDAKKRAPNVIKNRERAVTVEDFEALARETPGVKVARAKAIGLYHPKFSYDTKIPGVVTVIIVPESTEKKPIPSAAMLRTVCEYLNERRLITTELYVVPPRYKTIKVQAWVIAQSKADIGRVTKEAIEAINEHYHPLANGGWPFGGDIYISSAYKAILNVKGVKNIRELDLFVDGIRQPHCENVQIEPYYLVCSEEHEISVEYERNDERA